MAQTGMNAKEASILSSLPSPTLRDPMRCTKALSTIEVMVGDGLNGMQIEVNIWCQRPTTSGQGKGNGHTCTAILQPLAFSGSNVDLYSLAA